MQLFLRIFKPMARLLLRQNVAVGEVIQGLKESYLLAAEEQLIKEGEKATNARLAVLTGMDRNEVSRLRRGVDRAGKPIETESAPLLHLNRAARVVTNWPKKDGLALDLPYSGENSFFELVKRFSGGIPANSVLEELVRNKNVIRLDNGMICLVNDVYVPQSELGKLDVSSKQLSRLFSSVDHNLDDNHTDQAFLQLELEFKGLSDDTCEVFRQLSRKDMNSVLQQLAENIQLKHEQSKKTATNKEAPSQIRKTGVGVYFFDVYDDES
jgi:hypothetical protein